MMTWVEEYSIIFRRKKKKTGRGSVWTLIGFSSPFLGFRNYEVGTLLGISSFIPT